MAEPSSAPKPVVVRVKRKSFQSPLDTFWLEINDRPLKCPLPSISNSVLMGFEIGERLDFVDLSISESAQKVEFHTKKVFVQHLETISRSEATLDIVWSFMCPQKQGQLLIKAKQEKESSAKDENALQEMCDFYDIVRIDNEEKTKEFSQEGIFLEDQRLLSNYLPLLREVIPNAVAEIESDLLGHSQQEDYVYDLYIVNDVVPVEDSSKSYPLLKVQADNEDYYKGLDDLDYETDDSNAEDDPHNDYPDEISEVEDDTFECESEESEHSSTSDESTNEDLEHHGFSKDVADPLNDEELMIMKV